VDERILLYKKILINYKRYRVGYLGIHISISTRFNRESIESFAFDKPTYQKRDLPEPPSMTAPPPHNHPRCTSPCNLQDSRQPEATPQRKQNCTRPDPTIGKTDQSRSWRESGRGADDPSTVTSYNRRRWGKANDISITPPSASSVTPRVSISESLMTAFDVFRRMVNREYRTLVPGIQGNKVFSCWYRSTNPKWLSPPRT
jgi:hypothetical protein